MKRKDLLKLQIYFAENVCFQPLPPFPVDHFAVNKNVEFRVEVNGNISPDVYELFRKFIVEGCELAKKERKK